MRSDLPNVDDITDEKKRMSIAYSLPKWIVDHWVTHYGPAQTHRIGQALLTPTETTVRANIESVNK